MQQSSATAIESLQILSVTNIDLFFQNQSLNTSSNRSLW